MKGRPLVIVAVALAVSAASLAAVAQPPKKVYRIGYFQTAPRERVVDALKALEEGLRERGYVPGQNIVIEYLPAEGISRVGRPVFLGGLTV